MSQTLYDWCREHPEKQYLLDEWDYEANKDLTPKNTPHGRNKIVSWVCSQGHHFECSPSARTGGRFTNCPYCAGQKVLAGFNDLATTHPSIAAEWHPTKNGELKPEMVSKGCHTRVWWRDSHGHEWETTVTSRTKGGGCPICNSVKTSFVEGAIAYYLSKVFSDLTMGEKPKWLKTQQSLDMFIPSLNLVIEHDGFPWHNHIEKDKLKDLLCAEHGFKVIRIRDQKCPLLESSSVVILYSYTSAQQDKRIISEIAAKNLFEGLFVSPGYLAAYSKGMDVMQSINIEEDYDDICKFLKRLEYEKSLAYRFPEIAAELDPEKNDGILAENIRPMSDLKFWWKCKEGHTWNESVNARVHRSKGCPYCSGQWLLPGKNDLATVRPELAEEWDYEKNDCLPTEVTYGSGKVVWWKDKLGHSWQTVIANRLRGVGCPYCANQKVLKGFNDFATIYPVAAIYWDYEKNEGLTPEAVTYGSGKKAKWKCPQCGYRWERVIGRMGKNPYCPHCGTKYKHQEPAS